MIAIQNDVLLERTKKLLIFTDAVLKNCKDEDMREFASLVQDLLTKEKIGGADDFISFTLDELIEKAKAGKIPYSEEEDAAQ